MNRLFAVVAVLALAGCAAMGPQSSAIKEEPVTYRDGDTVMKGYIVYDEARQGRRPGVLVVHEWWGITKHVHAEARNLASQGYTAFIVDMYGDGKTADNPKDAGAMSGAVRKDVRALQSRFNAARDTMARHPTVDARRTGAIGFCFGGSVVLDVPEAERVTAALLERRVIVDHRPGAGIRLAPHFYTSDDDVSRALEQLDALVAAGGRGE